MLRLTFRNCRITFCFYICIAFKKSIVDDEFFKLSEMENFLLSEEKSETTKDKSKPLEDDVDIFQDLQSENEVYINKFIFMLKCIDLFFDKLSLH